MKRKGEEMKKVDGGRSLEDLAIELMTTRQLLGGGSEAAEELLGELRKKWGREIAQKQRVAHDSWKPGFHSGQPCRSQYSCHVAMVIDLAEDGVWG
jgi:hypothetical protein